MHWRYGVWLFTRRWFDRLELRWRRKLELG
jgi:hypothetical protein